MKLEDFTIYRGYYYEEMENENLSPETVYVVAPYLLNTEGSPYRIDMIGDVSLPPREEITSPISYLKFALGFLSSIRGKDYKNTKLKMMTTIQQQLDYESSNEWEQAMIDWCGNVLTSVREFQISQRANETAICQIGAIPFEKIPDAVSFDATYPKDCAHLKDLSISSLIEIISEYITKPKKYRPAITYIMNHILWKIPYQITKCSDSFIISPTQVIDIISKNSIKDTIGPEYFYYILAYFYSLSEKELKDVGFGVLKSLRLLYPRNDIDEIKESLQKPVTESASVGMMDVITAAEGIFESSIADNISDDTIEERASQQRLDMENRDYERRLQNGINEPPFDIRRLTNFLSTHKEFKCNKYTNILELRHNKIDDYGFINWNGDQVMFFNIGVYSYIPVVHLIDGNRQKYLKMHTRYGEIILTDGISSLDPTTTVKDPDEVS